MIGVNHAQWIAFRGLPGGDLAVANIYAPNNSQDQTILWLELAQSLPTGPRWILVGDWNMVLDSRN
jgi:hypothetical protein